MSLRRGVAWLAVVVLAACASTGAGHRDGGLSMEGATDPDAGDGGGSPQDDGGREPVGGGKDAGKDAEQPGHEGGMLDARIPPEEASVPDDARTPSDDGSTPDDASEPDANGPDASESDATIPDPSTCEPWTALVEPDAVICEQEPPPDVGPFGNRVALTFDDGPHPVNTPAILDILRAENIPATFFMVGRNLATPAAQAIALEIHEDPLFRVANHTFTHARLPAIELAQVAAQIDDTSAAIRTALQDPCYFPRFMRFPFSDSDCATMQVARERGYAVAGLHIDPADWCYARNAGYCAPEDAAWVPEAYRNDMIGYVISQLSRYGGGIVLLHDIHPNTAANLQALIDALQAAGVTFVALDDEAHFPLLNAQLEVPEPPECCNGVTR